MNKPVLMIGVDALPYELVRSWMSEGKLPNLARLKTQGIFGGQQNFDLYRTENSWMTLLQGCSPESSGEWGHLDYDAESYDASERAAYDFRKIPPFYVLGQRTRVTLFDVPLTRLVDGVNGIQVLGWGTEVNQIRSESSPPGLLRELRNKHGRHPLYGMRTDGEEDEKEILGYRIPSIYDIDSMHLLKDRLVAATRQRTGMILDLMQRQAWDLMLAVYAETHTALHLMWHLSQAHPLHDVMRERIGSDLMLEVIQAVDEGIGQLLAAVSDSAEVIVFSPHGMQSNTLDLYSMLVLPELLYRWSTGEKALCDSDIGQTPPMPRTDYSRHWREEIWDMRTPHGDSVLESPSEQTARNDPLDWDPGNWYRPCWPKMRAFTLPGYSEGLIRLNVQGRDGPGGIPADEFDQVSREIGGILDELKDARTGEPIVEKIIRVRETPEDMDPSKSPADLMVCWRDNVVTDVVDHPRLGRIGPVPFFRSGGHSTRGFVLARGEGFDPATEFDDMRTEDLTATVLDHLGVEMPAHVTGKPWQGGGPR